jgi:thiamine-monophosphate kinase
LSGIAHAMIDVSDGVLADLGHICETSEAAAIVELHKLPLSPAARVIVDSDPTLRARLAAAGDDYELLFTAPAETTPAIAALSSRLGIPITMIGMIEPGSAVRLVGADGQTIPVGQTGYRHF